MVCSVGLREEKSRFLLKRVDQPAFHLVVSQRPLCGTNSSPRMQEPIRRRVWVADFAVLSNPPPCSWATRTTQQPCRTLFGGRFSAKIAKPPERSVETTLRNCATFPYCKSGGQVASTRAHLSPYQSFRPAIDLLFIWASGAGHQPGLSPSRSISPPSDLQYFTLSCSLVPSVPKNVISLLSPAIFDINIALQRW